MSQKLNKGGVILIGYNVMFLAFLFVGPSIIFGKFNNSIILTLIGLAIMGLACSLIIIPVLPDMIESIE